MNITNPYRHTKFTPSSIDGLDLWLDASDSSTLFDATTGGSTPADDGTVARWEDKSGNNNHATQSTVADRPLRRVADVNGRDAVDFVSQDIMIGASPLTQRQTDEKTAFIVLETDTLGVSFGAINLYSHTSSFTTGAVGLITPEVAYRCGGPTWVSSSPVSTTSPSIVSMTHDGQANIQDAISMWVDGTSATNDLGTDGTFVDNNNGWHLGRQATQVADAGPYDGRICEVIIYNSELSTEDRESVETYLADKWGIISNSINSSKPKFNTFGRASRKFDGTNAVIIGDVLDEDVFTKDSWSISFWAKRDTEDSVQFLLDKSGASLHSPPENQRQIGCSFRGAADDYRLSFAWYGSLSTYPYRVHRTTTQVRVSDGWSHFTISYNKYDPVINNRIKIYRDGIEDVELWLFNGNPSQIQNGTARLAIGGSVGSVGSNNTTTPLLPLTGSMADVRLYDKVLSINEANLLSNGHSVNDQLVGHWLTNENDLEDHAVSVLSNEIPPFSTDGPLSGNASFGDTSRIFDNVTSGSRKIVRIKDFPEMPTGSQTWTAWVKLDARDNNGNGQDVFGQWDFATNQKGAIIYIPSTGKPNFYIGDTSNNAKNVESPVTFNANVWYHIAGTYNSLSQSLKIYINGSLSNTNTSSIPSVIKNSSVDIEIGSRDSINDLFLAGKIADCRIYDADIGASAIADLAVGTDYRTNLVGQWLTNSDDLLDHSGNNHHAYLLHNEVVKHHADNLESPEFSIEGPLPNNKTFGKNSLKFNGLNDKVDLGDVLSFEPNMSWTISAWAKADPSQTGTQWIAGRGRYNSADREMAIYWSAIDDKFRVQRGVGSTFNTVSSTNTFSAGSWHHVVGTYDGSTLELFVDGKSEATGASTLNITSTNTFQIGRSPDDGTGEFHWRGNIADVRIYDDVISEESISAIADGIHIQDNLVGWWGVNEKSLRNFANTYRSKYSTDSPFIDTSNFASRYFNPDNVATNPLEFVAIPNNSDIPKGEQTWSVWAKLNRNSTGGQSIIGQWGNSGNYSFIVYHISNKLSVVISGNGSTALSSGDITLAQIGVWHHIAFTFTPNGLLNVYVNGVLEKSVSAAISSLHTSTVDLRFGRMDRSYNAAFNGNISDVRMYDADIGAGVIASLANGEDYRTNLKGQWLTQFNNLLDYAGTNDGINSSSTFSNDNPFATELDFASRIFDGIDDHVNLGDALGDVFHGTGAKWTISTWVKANDLDDDLILSRWHYGQNKREFFFRVTPTGELAVSLSSDGTTSNRWGRKTGTGVITQNSWHHISVTYDQSATGNYLSIWVDGNEQALNVYKVDGSFSSIYNGGSDFYISGLPTENATMWEGNVADVRVYDTVISDIAILNLSQGIGYNQNLVGRWLTNSDDVDDYAGTNHGTNYGSIYSKGANPFNQIGITSRTLDGINDYITIPDINESTTNLSVALWVKTTDQDWVTTHLAHWRNTDNNRAWFIGPSRTAETNGKKLMVYLSADGDGLNPIKRYYGTTDVSDGTWHHVAFTWNNGTLKLFVDGSQETTTKVSDHAMTAIHNSNGPITVGCTWVNDAPANYGSGGRADIRIYNSTLNASDITDLYNGVDVQTGLAGHWLTNNNDDVDDYAGTNHGTNYGSSFNFENYNVRPTKFGVASRMFDGIDNQMSIPDINENVNNLTILFWLKTTENHWDRGLFSHWDINNGQRSWIFTLSNNSSNDGKGLSIVTSADGVNVTKRYYGGSVVSDGTWHHCGMTWDNGTLKLFVDGIEETSHKVSDGAQGSLFNSSGKITINGSKDGDNPMYLTKASMADCRIYNTTLSEGEILSIKSGKDNILNKNSLVGHWLTNVDSFNDFSGNGNHALPTISDGSFGGSQYSTQGPAS
jgi:hypothetical protein